MPAKDKIHDNVIRALRRDKWQVTGEQIAIVLPGRRLWIDIRAEKPSEQRAILVEVKSFANVLSPVEYLAAIVGKYVLYQNSLSFLDIKLPLYLAVPESAYNGILSEIIGQQAILSARIRLLVVNPKSEEIILWQH